MTSAATLFFNRRSRCRPTDTDLGFDAVPPDRNFHSNRRYHGYDFINQRHEPNGFDPPRRSEPHRRHFCSRGSYPLAQERAAIRLDQSTTQLFSSTSSNANTLTRTSRIGLTASDRLPGDVLLARARLFERLRGVPLMGNRQDEDSLRISRSGLLVADDLRHDETRHGGTEIPTSRFPDSSHFESPSQNEGNQFLPEPSNRPPGLTQDVLNCLHLEYFGSLETGVDGLASGASRDCSICLEGFVDGDKLIRLPCEHRFHSICLDPWVRTCGDCPYCRRGIIVDFNSKKS